MNANPRRNLEGLNKTVVCIMRALENKLEKGQESGDATKVITSGEIEKIDDLTPKMETSVGKHIVDPNRNCRVLPNGENLVKDTKINEKRRELQLAMIEEQKEAVQDIDNEK